MSYAGVERECPHGGTSMNCTQCIIERREKTGTRGPDGKVHGSNGGGDSGYCYGCPTEGPGDGHLTVLVRFCPVLNTPQQIALHHKEDHDLEVRRAQDRLARAHQEVRDAADHLLKVKTGG